MLQHLSIKNYALINQLELSLYNGFSVITGETGAGKSIILGALNLVLGKRADLKVLKNNHLKCVVEGTFLLNQPTYASFFERHDLDFEEETIIRREILPSGKSRAFINDTPVKLSILSALAESVVDVHSQHQTLLLSDSQYQLSMLDSFAENDKELKAYEKSFFEYSECKREVDRLKKITDNEVGDVDYLMFLLKELIEAKLAPNEQENIEEELQVLEHAEEIEANFEEIKTLANDGDNGGVRAALKTIENSLRSLSRFHKEYDELGERLESTRIEFEDIIREVELQSGESDFEPGRMDSLDQRLTHLINLQRKHGVDSVEELIAKKDELQTKVDSLSNVEEHLKKACENLDKAQKELEQQASKLHDTRQKAAPKVEDRIKTLLQLLNMKTAEFSIEVTKTATFTKRGFDDINFLFTANKGIKPQSLSKVASGGEMSRVMLALKATMAQKNELPSIIFDEIDTGVSGETAGKIGMILKEMGANMQVIAITHLPQIAGMGNEHYKVVKETEDESTLTNILHLKGEERLTELARLLSGEEISDAALANARSLLKQNA